MSFFAILLALIAEQIRPLSPSHALSQLMREWMHWMARTLDTGSRRQAWLAWWLTVLLPALAAWLVHSALLYALGWLAAMAWNVALLYVTLGFRQFSHHFTDIREALNMGDEQKARELLAEWQHVDVGQISRSEIMRHVIEQSVLAAHRHVFGVFFWYSVLAVVGLGPLGAVIYRLAATLPRSWSHDNNTLLDTSRQAWRVIDWLPARATALGFAMVGNFEEVMDGWRFHAQKFPQDNDGVVLAATAGAINVQLGGADLNTEAEDKQDSSSTPGHQVTLADFAQVVGLVWRSVVMWLVLLALLSMANLLG
ncbi:MAG: Cobalamin biosynthesis protein CbiB [Pseudomonadota bacterium]